MSRRNEGSYRERNGIGSSVPITAHVAKIASVMDRSIGPDLSLPAGNDTCARLESELADTRAALDLAPERAEDAEADLEEARLELDQFRGVSAMILPVRPAPALSAAPIESPAVTAIAAKLVAVMAENEHVTALPLARTRKRMSKLIPA
jgi:hypothetical protein